MISRYNWYGTPSPEDDDEKIEGGNENEPAPPKKLKTSDEPTNEKA